MAQILVIEDDELHRSLLVSVLAGAGHAVTEAADGKRGLEAAKLNIPDLVVTDLVMPEKEGIETIMELRRQFPEIGIIAMSGAGHASTYLELASKLGAQATLAKPFPACARAPAGFPFSRLSCCLTWLARVELLATLPTDRKAEKVSAGCGCAPRHAAIFRYNAA